MKRTSREVLRVPGEQRTNSIQDAEQYRAFIRNSSEGIWRFDLEKPISIKLKPETQIQHLYKFAYLAENNAAMAEMHGFRSSKSLAGKRLGEFMPEADPVNAQYLREFIESGYNLSGVESHEQDKHGRDRYFLNSLVGVVDNGHVTRVWGTRQSVTNQKIGNEALQRSEERLNLALQASSMGLWEWEVSTDTLYWSPALRRIYGIGSQEVMTYEKYMQMIHPEDRKHAEEVAYHSMQTGEMYQFEHRIGGRDGNIHWLLGTGRAYLENGKPVRMVGTSMNIDAVKQAQELRMLNTQLMALSKAKDEFIALASHQLRTPATAVKQYISLLMDEMAGPVSIAQRKFLKIAFDSNERELRIIDDLLKTAQIDSNLYMLDKRQYDLAEVVRFAIDELKTALDLKKQTVTVKGLKSAPLSFDLAEMKLVLVNLLENASKYSHDGTKITIQLHKQGEYLEMSVEDNGVGIRQQDIHRIFDKFSRVDNELSDTVTGTGLGLYWTKRIVDLHGGSIQVVSEVGKGSCFKVRLPYE